MRLIDALGVGSGGVVVLDGGLSTELERAGVDTGGALWTAAPLLVGDGSVERAHEAFASAGAEVVVTASYQLGVDWLEDRGIDSNAARDLLIESTRAARRGVAGAALVAASVGPFGAGRADGSEYTGDYRDRFDEVRRHHRAKIAVLLESAPDLLAVETIPLADELEIVIEILDEFGSPPAWFSVACRDDATTHGGDPLERVGALLAGRRGPTAVGVNCTAPEHSSTALRRIADSLGPSGRDPVDLVAYPNIGRRWDPSTRKWRSPARPFDETVLENLARVGATFVGGCCGTDSADVARVRAWRDRRVVSPT
jgi:homocysteine S-methyltransferase